MTALKLLAFAAMALLAACGPDEITAAQPREPDKNAVGFFCRMGVTDHEGPKGQIFPKGWADPLWFSSVRDALTYAETEVVSEAEMAAFWVNDMGHGSWAKPAPGAWVEARSAWYVIESRMVAGMGGGEAVPFKDRKAASAFAAVNGGRVVDYGEAKRSVAPDASLATGGET